MMNVEDLQGKKIMVLDLENAKEGWGSHADQGISVNCSYDYSVDKYGISLSQQDIYNFAKRIEGPEWTLVGFNSIAYDVKMLSAYMGKHFNCKWEPKGKHFDLLKELKAALPKGSPKGGYKMDQVVKANLKNVSGKLQEGAMAPILFKAGRIGELIEYCLHDVRLTRKLLEKAYVSGMLKDPNHGGAIMLSKSIDQCFHGKKQGRLATNV